MQSAPGRVFIHHDGALGDVLLSLPCLRKIRSSAGFLHLACSPEIGEFLQQVGLADAVSRVDSLLYSQLYADLPADLSCGELSSFDIAYLFTARESRFADNLRQCIPDVRIIRTIPPGNTPEHAAYFRFRQCGDCDDLWDRAPLALPAADRLWAERLLEGRGIGKNRDRLLVVHPGSGGIRKCWPLKNYLDLIQTVIEDRHTSCIVLSGPAEPEETISSLQGMAANNPGVMHLHDEPLLHVAAVLDSADHYLGNDSGISHLASAMCCRGTILFGPTDPQVWRPMYEGMRTVQFIQDGDCESVTTVSVIQLILAELRTKRRP